MARLFRTQRVIRPPARAFIKVLAQEAHKHDLTLRSLHLLSGYSQEYFKSVILCQEKMPYEFGSRLKHLMERGPTEIEWCMMQMHAKAKIGLLLERRKR